jgi:CHAT domain
MAEGIPEYDELKLRIEPGPREAYRVIAFGPDGSTAEGTFSAPFSREELERFVWRVGIRRRSTRGYRSSRMEEARDFGDRLRAALLNDDVREVYLRARGAADSQHRGLRVTLYLTGVPELMEIPWEFLYDRPSFLSQSIFTPVVRSLDLKGARPPRTVTLPLRVLGVVSSPAGFPRLDIDDEQQKLERALDGLRSRGMVQVNWLSRGTLAELDRAISAPDEEHVLHYIGHGAYDERTEDGAVVLEGTDRGPHEVTGAELCSVLQDERSLRLAVLNSCEGARTSHVDPFSGVASSLVECGIPAVIGMQFEITDDAAITFSERLYTGLAQGYPVDAALAQARKAIFAGGHEIEFGTPVLYLRGANARLFDVEAPPPTAPTPRKLGLRRKPADRVRASLGRSRRLVAAAALLAIAAIIAVVAVRDGPEDADRDGRVVTGPQAESLLDRFARSFNDGDVKDVSAVLGADLKARAVANPVLDKDATVGELTAVIETGATLDFTVTEPHVVRDGPTVVDSRYRVTPDGAPEEFANATIEVSREQSAIVITKIHAFPDLVWDVSPPQLNEFTAAARAGEAVVGKPGLDSIEPGNTTELRMSMTEAGRRTLRDGTDVTFAYSGFTAAGREEREQETVTYLRFRLFAPTVIAPKGS